MSQLRRERVNLAREGRPAAGRRGAKATVPATVDSPLLGLQRGAGNHAVARLLSTRERLVQRALGWTDAVKEGYGWNVDERPVAGGKVRRIPLEGLSQGLRRDKAKRRWVWDDRAARKGHWEEESTLIPQLSPESAKGRAIVLVPAALDATQEIEVVVFLHGHTEGTHRPFAGWRTLPSLKSGRKPGKQDVERLRQGIDPTDVAPVRDVALDEAGQQLAESAQAQTVIVLPQGGLHSQFGIEGERSFDSVAYVNGIVSRLLAEGVWKDAKGTVVKKAPRVGRVSMAGHSGAGATLSSMASSSALKGDLVLYDAIHDGELGVFKKWVEARLNEALAVIKSNQKEADKLDYIWKAPKLRGYATAGAYLNRYIQLDDFINKWFADHAAELGTLAPFLRSNFVLAHVKVGHEELMRGVKAGTARGGAGSILDALKGLHPRRWTTTANPPPMPAPLRDVLPKPKPKPKPKARQKATVP